MTAFDQPTVELIKDDSEEEEEQDQQARVLTKRRLAFAMMFTFAVVAALGLVSFAFSANSGLRGSPAHAVSLAATTPEAPQCWTKDDCEKKWCDYYKKLKVANCPKASLKTTCDITKPCDRLLTSSKVLEGLDGIKASTRKLVSTDKMSKACGDDFGARLMKSLGAATAMAFKVMLACHHGHEDAPDCVEAKGDAEKLEQDLKDDCVKEASTDVCTMSGGKLESAQDLCLPKTCQNADDEAAIAKDGASIDCGGGGGGLFAPLFEAFGHLR